jgi:hypothetical protein
MNRCKMDETINEILNKNYYDLKKSSGFSSIQKLYKESKK